MAHPHRRALVDVREQVGGVVDKEGRLAVLSAARGHHRATQLLNHQLHAVADTQHRNTQIPNPGIALRGVVGVHRAGTTTEDDPLGIQRL